MSDVTLPTGGPYLKRYKCCLVQTTVYTRWCASPARERAFEMNIRALVTFCLIVVVPTEGVYLKTPENQKGVWLTQDPSWVVNTCCNPAYRGGVTHDATKALDGDIRTYWNPWSGEGRYYNNWYIVLDLAASYTLSRIAVNNEGDRARSIASFTLQKSQVGSPYNWEDVKSVGNVQVGTNRRQEFGGFRGTARYWRFVVTRTHKGWQPFLAELNLYGLPAGETTKPTEFCRNNPNALSCMLAKDDPDSAYRLYQENQWAFLPLEPEDTYERLQPKREVPWMVPACKIYRKKSDLQTLPDREMEPFSLQAYGLSKYQGYTHVECAEPEAVINCAGECQTRMSAIKFLIISNDDGKNKVLPTWVELPTGCEFEMEM